MKCPNCGEEIKEGYLYCENCGEDIHIVPDYEPELELSLMQSVGEILDEEAKQKRLEQERFLQKKQRMQKRMKGLVIAGVVCLLIAAGILIVNLVKEKNHSSHVYQTDKARACVKEGQMESALTYYERALELSPQNAEVRLELAEVYLALGYEESYLEQLHTVAAAYYSSHAEIAVAYEKLIAFWETKEEYKTINELLRACTSKTVLEKNQKYLANPPKFSYEGGTYAETIPLKISSDTSGTIYYTLDGSVPDEESEKYDSPIFLETGSHVVSAVFVNNYGIVSETTVGTYVIEVQKPAAPEVSVYSGEYLAPVSITVEVMDGCRVFYTTDGSFPTEKSNEYQNPIPMPLGKSYYKFVAYNAEGIAGEVTSREYKLTIDTEVTVDEACQAVIDIMLQNGKIYNSLGESYIVEGKYLYIFQYPLAVPEKGDYYVIIEVYEDPGGLRTETGLSFAVNIYDESVYKFTNNNGNYLLEGF